MGLNYIRDILRKNRLWLFGHVKIIQVDGQTDKEPKTERERDYAS